jgi:hypothetical protein
MSLSRQMRRKMERDKAKAEKRAASTTGAPGAVLAPAAMMPQAPVLQPSIRYIRPEQGSRSKMLFTVDDIYDDEQVKRVAAEWLEDQYNYLTDAMAEDTTQLLWEAENNVCYINTLLMLMTVEKTFGELKTVQRGMEKLLRNMGPCLDRIQQEGPKKCLAELKEKYDIGEIEFDTFQENQLFDKEARMKLTMQMMRDKWEREREERKKRKKESKGAENED